MSKTRILIHIVFSTRHREPSIPAENKRRLYAYLHGIVTKHRCTTLRINGMSDHVHLLIDLHPAVALSSLVKELKQSSSLWMKDQPDFAGFSGWNDGYYAASIGAGDEEECIGYIINQEHHHQSAATVDEARWLAMEYKLEWDSRDW